MSQVCLHLMILLVKMVKYFLLQQNAELLNDFAFLDPRNKRAETLEQKVMNIFNLFTSILHSVERNEKDCLASETRRFHLD